MSDLRGVSRDLGECSCDRRASLRLPPLDLDAECFVTVSTNALIACAYEIAKMNFISLQLRASTSATVLGIRGSATSASPTRPRPSRSNVSTALILAPWSGTEIS